MYTIVLLQFNIMFLICASLYTVCISHIDNFYRKDQIKIDLNILYERISREHIHIENQQERIIIIHTRITIDKTNQTQLSKPKDKL